MQTFLPYPCFKKSLQCLDYRRLGKQRVEAFQLLKSIKDSNYSWAKHPASKMWKKFPEALKLYMNMAIIEWKNRGYNNTMKLEKINWKKFKLPDWFGNQKFHSAHRSNLLRKDYIFYSKNNWKEDTKQEYFWPV